MIVLNTANRSLQYLLGGAVTANQLPFVVQYVNVTSEGVTHNNSANGISNSGTAVTVLGAPSAGEKRVIQSFSVYNADTASATVTVRLNDNGTLRNIVVVTLSASDHLIYTNAAGWFVLTSAGFIKSTSTAVNLDDLGDVVITSPATGAVLIYNGTNWVDGQIDLDDADAVTGTLAIANGGTGRASHTAYAVICGGTKTTAAQQSIAGVGTATQVLTSNVAGLLPTFQAASTTPADGSVTQAKLSTTTGEVSTAVATHLTLPGGTYGFYPQTKVADGTSVEARITLAITSTSYVTRIYLDPGTSSLMSAQQRYVQASPPYNLGDGDVSLFVF